MTKTSEEAEQDFPHDKAQQLFLNACFRLFSELALGSLMLGIRHKDLSQTLKAAMINVAQERIKEFNREENFISIATSLTGIPRAGLKVEERTPETQIQKNTIIGRTVQLWRSQDRYPTEGLPRRTRTDKASLWGLVNQALEESRPKSEVRAKAVIQAMEVGGIIFEGPKDHFNLHHRAFRTGPDNELEEDFGYLSNNVGAHLAAALHNILLEKGKDKMFERSYHPTLSPSAEAIEKIRKTYTSKGSDSPKSQEDKTDAREHERGEISVDELRDMDFINRISDVLPDKQLKLVRNEYRKWLLEKTQVKGGMAQCFLQDIKHLVENTDSAISADNPEYKNIEQRSISGDKGFRVGIYFWMPEPQ